MPRGGACLEPGRPRQPEAATLSTETLRCLLACEGLAPELGGLLARLEGHCKQQEVARAAVQESGVLEALLTSVGEDFSQAGAAGGDLPAARLRLLKLKLLTNLSLVLVSEARPEQSAAVLACCCSVLQRAVSGAGRWVRPEERAAGLALLSCLLHRAQGAVVARLGEVLGYLAVLAGLHPTKEGVSLEPTNLPHLHFTRTSNSEEQRELAACPETSESELSDHELISETDFRIKRVEAMVQRDALANLGVIAKRFPKKDVVSFWFVFLPDASYSPLSSSLADLATHYSKKTRYQSLAILTDFVSHSVQFVALAQHSSKPSSFTSLSTALALALLSLHRLLLARLRESLGPTEMVALLKLLAALTENCDYSRLGPGLLEQVIEVCLTVAREERNPVIQVASLSVFSSLCVHCSPCPSLTSSGPDIFSFMSARARPDTTATAPDNNVRYMALQAMAGFTAVHLQIFLKNAPEVKRLIDFSLLDPDPSIVLHTFRFIKNFVRSLTALVETELKNVGAEPSRNKNMAVSFWADFLKPANFELLDKYPNANIKSAFCDCLAELGGLLFAELPEAKKLVAITYVLGQCSVDLAREGCTPERLIQDRAALSSCLRTLGIFIMFSAYQTDTAFHIDVADAVLPHLPKEAAPREKKGQLADPNNKAVRVSASWALANLTDTLVQAELERQATGEPEDFPVSLAKRILLTSIVSAQDAASAVNTKSNAVRCVGNMLYYLTRERVGPEEEFDSLMAAGTACLVTNIRSGKIMKIRWNACYAASNIMRKEGLEADYAWKRELVDCLLDTVVNFENFKVRINAAVALGSAGSRGCLGSLFLGVVAGLLHSLETCQGGEVLGEWQHQENLVSQLCCSLCSLLALCSSSQELAKVAGILADQWDLVSTSFSQSVRRISPEKTSSFLLASQTADRLGRDSGREEVTALVSLLTECSNNY